LVCKFEGLFEGFVSVDELQLHIKESSNPYYRKKGYKYYVFKNNINWTFNINDIKKIIKIMEISKEKLQKLVDSFYEAAAFCNELNIYELEEGDSELSDMKEWINDNIGRNLEKIN